MTKAPVKNIWEKLNNVVLVRFLLLFASGWALIELLSYFETVFVIFTSATILAFLLSYPAKWLQRFLPHGVAVSLIFLVSMVLIGAISMTISLAVLSQGRVLADSVTEFLNSLAPVVSQLEQFLSNWGIQVNLEAIEEQLREQALDGLRFGLSVIPIFLANLINLIFIAVVAFFMLLDGERLWQFTLKVIPIHLRIRFTETVRRNLLGFFWGRLLLSLFFGISSFLTFLLLNVPFALVLAIIAGLFDLIPGIGATLGISLVCLILLSEGVWLALKVLVICVLLQQVEENLLLPHVMKGSLDINPVVMFFALLVGARIAGIFGVFLAIPIAGVVVSLLEIEEMKGRSPIERLPRGKS
ncbi:MAG: AI-2E family transporter [Elainellaceae cyanobacterium]